MNPSDHGSIRILNARSNAEELCFILPDSWSCPERNTVGVVSDYENNSLSCKSPSSAARSHIQQQAALIVSNRPISINALSRLSAKYHNQGSEFNFNKVYEQQDAPSVYPNIHSAGIYRKPSRHRRVKSKEKINVSDDSKRKSISVYYFEVTVKRGNAWIGFVPKESIVSEPMKLAGENEQSQKMDPHPVLMTQKPENVFSIVLAPDGKLLVQGTNVNRNSHSSLHSLPSEKWTDPIKEGDIIGCGLELGESCRVFFTKNGEILYPMVNKGFFNSGSILFPSIAISTDESQIYGNFGQGSDPLFCWKDDHHLKSYSAGKHASRAFAPPPPRNALKKSNSTKKIKTKSKSPSKQFMKNATEMAMDLEKNLNQRPLDLSYLNALVQSCQKYQEEVRTALENENLHFQDYDALLNLNDYLNQVLKSTEPLLKNSIEEKPNVQAVAVGSVTEEMDRNNSGKHFFCLKMNQPSPEVTELMNENGIFSLICLLRGKSETRYEAAWALMRFAKDKKSLNLLGEIRSSGGMHSLLTIFKSKTSNRNLKLVAALAVSYLFTSFTDRAGLTVGHLGLRIAECLRFILNVKELTDDSELNRTDIVQSATLAVTHLWLNLLEPALSGTLTLALTRQGRNSKQNDSLDSLKHVTSRFTKRGDKWNGPLEIQELHETTISLIVDIGQIIMSEGFSKGNIENMNIYETLRNNAACTIESICTLEHARPIAVRVGLLPVLVQWIDSNNIDLQRPAANALRNLTKPNDEYVAGWIHSQIVNEGALSSIVQLSASNALDIRLSVAQILKSLTIAPHTRAAIVDAKGIKYIVQLLVNSSEHSVEHEKIFLAAASSLLQLGTNAIKYSRGWTPDDIESVVSLHRRDDVINDIIRFGAIEPFISMAISEERGKLRLLSVEALCVLSEDEKPARMTRQKLCEAGIAIAFGNILRQDVRFLYEIMQKMMLYDCEISDEESNSNELFDEEILLELYRSLHSFANILEPVYNEDEKWVYEYEPKTTAVADHRSMLTKVCLQSAQSGGLDSLLLIGSLPIFSCCSLKEETIVYLQEIVAESCRSIASICPYLLSLSKTQNCFGETCVNAMLVLAVIIQKIGTIDEWIEVDTLRDLQLDALRGIASLADCEPLKIRIIDLCLPQLLQLNQSRGEGETAQIVQVSNQVCTTLGFTEDEMDVKLTGNEPKLLADWFCLERSMLLQAMARDEVKYVLYQIWRPVFAQMEKNEVQTVIRRTWENSDLKWLIDLSEDFESDLNNSKHNDWIEMESIDFLKQIFRNIGCDDDTLTIRNNLLEQYGNIYGISNSSETDRELEKSLPLASKTGRNCLDDSSTDCTFFTSEKCSEIKIQHPLWEMLRHLRDDSDIEGSKSLNSYCFKKIGNLSESQWLLKYKKIQRDNIQNSEILCSLVEDLLKIYFPSKLLQHEVLPLSDINLKSCFDFRALQMPMRRYFSFRREGQVISRICEKYASSIESEGVYWTLGFENSTFAGEFAETLVQTLYRCPIIRALSFSRREKSLRRKSLSNDDDNIGSTLLVNLAVSLPPWVSWITFDNVLSKKALAALIRMFDITEHSYTKSNSKSSQNQMRKKIGSEIFEENNALEETPHGQCHWTFRGLSIKDSPHLGASSFLPFFSILSSNITGINGVESSPLSCLHSLDLSGNMLGDECVATLLKIIYNENSVCSIESLDISSNNISKGGKVIEVFRNYCGNRSYELNDWRFHVSSKTKLRDSSLRKLYLSSNSLRSAVVCELIQLLENNKLNLQTLDLSDNNIVDERKLLHIISSSLFKNTDLLELNLSKNQFSHEFMKEFVKIIKPKYISSNLAFIKFDHNIPPLSDTLLSDLSHFSAYGRVNRLRKLQHKTPDCISEGKNISNSYHMYEIDEKSETEFLPSTQQQNIDLSKSSVTPEPIVIPPSFVSPSKTNQSSVRIHDHSLQTSPDVVDKKVMEGGNTIKVLTSAPLVWRNKQTGELNPIEVLDFELEREILYQCLIEASRDIDLSFDTATTQRLQTIVTKSCSCLHFSGHGHPNYLTFEDNRGGLHWLENDQLKNLVSMGVRGGGAPFQFVFVSACYSGLAGETFVNAGVPHVVCCQQDSELMDSAALVFTRAFYLALAIGRTVKDSFDIGRQAVEVAPQVPNPTEETKKFILLPKDGKHDVPVFNAEKIDSWPKLNSEFPATGVRRSGSIASRQNSSKIGSVRGYENVTGGSALQDINLPTPPQSFLGREIDMYKVLNAILDKKFVNIIGQKGLGRSSLAAALCQYINERRSTFIEIEFIFYVSVKKAKDTKRTLSFIDTLHDQLILIGKATHPSSNLQFDKMSSIINALKPLKALIVFEELDALEGPDKAQGFPLFLSSLFRETKAVRVLTTSFKALRMSCFGSVVEWQYKLAPLNFRNTVRLFANQSPFIHTGEDRRRFLENMVLNDEQGAMCKDDIRINERTKILLNKLGSGIPSRIFDTANNMKKNEFDMLSVFSNDSGTQP